jgi:TadE-like protein
MPGRRLDGRRGERASTTAETALVLPVLVGLVATLVWLIGAGVAQVRCVDAARDAARALARGEPDAQVVAAAEQSAPEGARIAVQRHHELVEVRVGHTVTPPGDLLDGLVALPIGATSSLPIEQGGMHG